MNAIVPLYYQIKHFIKNAIINKEYAVGERIPSENELAHQFKVTRLTVRQALAQLIQEGFLFTKRGHGTFVVDDKKLIDSLSLEFTGFMDDLFYQVTKTKTKSAVIRIVETPNFLFKTLNLNKNCKKVVQIKRLRLKEERSFAYTINYLPIEIGTKITEAELLKKPLLQIVEQDLGIELTEAFQTIEASFADYEVAEILGIPIGSPLLYVERTMYTQKRKPFEFVQTSYRGDLYKYIVRLKTDKRKKGNIWIHQY